MGGIGQAPGDCSGANGRPTSIRTDPFGCGHHCRALGGATCMFFLREVDDRDKLQAIAVEMATDLTS